MIRKEYSLKTLIIDEKAPSDKNLDEIQELVKKARQNPRYFGEVYDLYFQKIFRYIYSRVGNQSSAEDITSKTFLSALQNLPTYKEKGLFTAWLFSIARSKINDHFRKLGKETFQPIQDIPDGKPNLLINTIQKETRKLLFGLIAGLPEDKRELVRLRYVANLRFREIAALQGKSEASVKKALYRVLEELRMQLEVDDE